MLTTRSKLSAVLRAVALALVAVSCSDTSLVSPSASRLTPAQAARNGAPGTSNFLPPLGTGTADPATFDATGATAVQVCVWTGSACSGAQVAQFTTAAGTLTTNTSAGRFEVSWNITSTSFLTRKTYRITALKGSTEIGSVLVDVVRGRYGLTRTDGTLAPLTAASTVPIQFFVAVIPPPPIKINEVESNGGVPGDWIELYNTGSTAVDLGGLVVKDNDDTHVYTIPGGTMIAAGGYYVVEEAALGFGLGAAESARLFTASGTVIDSHTWLAHAVTTYGRCPNGTGSFSTNTTSTKGAVNDCTVPNTVVVNEVEGSGGTPGDWIELFNTGTIPVDLSGYVLKDNDDTHIYTIPNGTTIAAGAYLVVEEASLGYGLGSPDAARLFNTTGTLLDSYSWGPHATTTYGRCPNGTGAFATTASSTKGAANNCGVSYTIAVNEVESNGGTPGDWIELYNTGAAAVDVSGLIVKDNDDTHSYAIPSGTVIAAGGFLVVEEAQLGFGLGAADAARLFSGSTLVDSYAWTAHAASTWGRCPNGTGAFGATTSSKGVTNTCTPTGPVATTWPGSDDVVTVDSLNQFSSNLSGVVFEAAVGGSPDVLWAARNGPGSIYRMILSGSTWIPDAANGWDNGKLTKYTDGTGEPDTEDLTYTTGSLAGMYIASERNNQANSISRPSILRFDVSGSGTTLTATNEWLLTADLPAVAANSGLEAITWVPDSYLVAQGFFDPAAGHLYNPADYPNHGGGLFFVGLEANGLIYVYALDHVTNGFTRITSVSTGFPSGVMALQFDRELNQLWATCDDTCGGLSNIYIVDITPGSPTLGRLKLTNIFNRPSTMPNINNEGFAFAPQSACVAGLKPAFWSDDSNTGGHSIRKASIPCTPFP